MAKGRFFFSSRRRHARFDCDWSSDVCSSDLFVRASGRRPDKAQAGADGIPRRAVLDLEALVRRERDWKSVVLGKSVDLGGRRIIKKKLELRKDRSNFLIFRQHSTSISFVNKQ